MTNVTSAITTGADIDPAIQAFTPSSAPGHSWSLALNSGILSVTNTGTGADVALVNLFTSQGGADLPPALAVVPVSSGGTVTLDLSNFIPSTPFFDVAVVSASGPGLNGDGAAVLSFVPEPSTLTLFSIGLLGLLGYGWRRCKQAA